MSSPTSPTTDLDALRAGDAWVDRSDRGFVTVSGTDAYSFLQALVSADLDGIADGAALPSLLLTPQGKLDVDFRLLRVGDDAWLDCDPGMAGQLVASLNRFKIRVQADVTDRSGELGMLSRVGDLDVDVPAGVHVVPTRWGVDLLGPVADLPRPGHVVDAAAFDAWRIEQGVAVQPLDIDESTIPQEAFLEQDAVSFTKGCFLGQELVCRIDTRGHVNRFLRRFTQVEGEWPVRGAEVVADGKVVGALTSVAPAALPTGALGYVRREVEPPTTVELRWPEGSARAVVEALS
jgi:folate-binding protein YgfZ